MNDQKKSKGLHIALWVVQGLLGLAFFMAGFTKIIQPIPKLAEAGMNFVNHYSVGMVRLIGVAEVLGALGLILPAAFRIKPNLTPLAALGLTTVMLLACWEHYTHQESFMPTLFLLVLSAFVAWGRFKKAPILPK